MNNYNNINFLKAKKLLNKKDSLNLFFNNNSCNNKNNSCNLKINILNSLNEVECFLNNFNDIFNYIKLYKFFK
jgi:hypothetical protein